MTHKFNSLSVFAGITGSLSGTASYATVAQTLLGSVTSASFATTSSFASTAQTLLGSVTSASYATSASFAPTILPVGVVSSSLQINTGSFTGSFTGALTGTSSWASNAISASAATSITFVPASSSYALTASYAANASAADFNTLLNKPTLVSSSLQINTGSFTGSFTGTMTGTSSWASNVTSASFATTSSFASTAQTLLGSVTSASYSATASLLLGSVTSASYAVTSSHALGGRGYVIFPQGLDITGSLNVSGSITGSGLLLTTREVASASADGTYSTNEQDLLNQIKATLIKYGMLS